MNLGPAADDLFRDAYESDHLFRVGYESGNHRVVYVFADAAIAAKWNIEVLEIKHHIASINEIRENNLGNQNNADYDPWLARVDRFRLIFGNPAVPGDIREAVHDVQDGIGAQHTVF